jgi:hypothetical protein
MRKKMQWQWEMLDECTQRAAVIGGWLILRLGATDVEKGKSGKVVFRESMTFVPDRDHEWHIVPPIKEVEAPKQTVKADDFK